MTDLEIIKKCAEKMGMQVVNHGVWGERITDGRSGEVNYDPLHDDAQAMALVKKFGLHISQSMTHGGVWTVTLNGLASGASSLDLNRAICECVSRL